jgi:hypothetical protein
VLEHDERAGAPFGRFSAMVFPSSVSGRLTPSAASLSLQRADVDRSGRTPRRSARSRRDAGACPITKHGPETRADDARRASSTRSARNEEVVHPLGTIIRYGNWL